MFKNVLVGVDGRPNGRDAIALATLLTDPDGKLTLAHVHPSHAIAPATMREEQDASHKLLAAERATADVKAELVSILSMSPGRGLHEQAEELGADLIVVGSTSHGVFGRAMLGDDTRGALNGAPCAVAIASRGYAEHPRPLANVGVAYNDSVESKAALTLAQRLAAPTNVTVHALEVVSIPSYAYAGLTALPIGENIQPMIDEAKSRMNELRNVEGHTAYGLTGEELAAFSNQVDLLVVGSRGYGPVKRLVLGSTSDYLQRHARCSLLVLARAGANPGNNDSTA
jgi:nucleotide-binding universal stress UspA family protein